MKPKLLIIGHGRHGKDTVAEILAERGYTFKSSSLAAAEIFIYLRLKDQFGYNDFEECYNDRNSSDEKRKIWYDLICEYNRDDRARLARDILKTSDCYVGMRDRGEIDACVSEKLFDLVIWVDASDRLSYREPGTSFKIDKSYGDIIIDNNGSLDDLKIRVNRLFKVLYKTECCGAWDDLGRCTCNKC